MGLYHSICLILFPFIQEVNSNQITKIQVICNPEMICISFLSSSRENLFLYPSVFQVHIKLNMETMTVRSFEERILKGALNMVAPDAEIDGKGLILISSEEVLYQFLICAIIFDYSLMTGRDRREHGQTIVCIWPRRWWRPQLRRLPSELHSQGGSY